MAALRTSCQRSRSSGALRACRRSRSTSRTARPCRGGIASPAASCARRRRGGSIRKSTRACRSAAARSPSSSSTSAAWARSCWVARWSRMPWRTSAGTSAPNSASRSPNSSRSTSASRGSPSTAPNQRSSARIGPVRSVSNSRAKVFSRLRSRRVATRALCTWSGSSVRTPASRACSTPTWRAAQVIRTSRAGASASVGGTRRGADASARATFEVWGAGWAPPATRRSASTSSRVGGASGSSSTSISDHVSAPVWVAARTMSRASVATGRPAMARTDSTRVVCRRATGTIAANPVTSRTSWRSGAGTVSASGAATSVRPAPDAGRFRCQPSSRPPVRRRRDQPASASVQARVSW